MYAYAIHHLQPMLQHTCALIIRALRTPPMGLVYSILGNTSGTSFLAILSHNTATTSV